MTFDDDAVGGFLEDLPVLALVILGVFALMSTSVFASQELSERRDAERLNSTAEDIVHSIEARLTGGGMAGDLPMVAGMRQVCLLDLTSAIGGDASFCASIVLLHPRVEWLSSAALGDERAMQQTGFADHMMNAVFDDGSVAVVRVMALAW